MQNIKILRAYTCGDEKVNGFVIGIFTGDGKVPPLYGLPVLGGDLLPQSVEALHGVFELLPETVHYGGPSTVGRGPGSTAGEAAVGGVGAVKRLEFDLDELGLLEGERDVGVHAGSEVLDGLGVVESLALLVGAAEGLVEAVQLLEFVLD